jgi:hypothetical protein
MKLLKITLLNRYILGALALVIAWQGYVFLRRDPVVWTHSERDAAVAAAERLAAELEARVPRRARIGVVHFVGDPHDLVTETVKAELARRDGWSVEEGSVIRKFLGDVSRTMLDATSVEELVNAGRRVELDVLVGGRVGEFRYNAADADGGGERCGVSLDVRVYELRAGRTLFNESVAAEVAVQAAGAPRPFRLRHLLIWLLIAALLPWLTAFATHSALERRSNVISAVLVTGYALTDVLLYHWLVGVYAGGGWRLVMWAGLAAGCWAYNWFICEKVAQ